MRRLIFFTLLMAAFFVLPSKCAASATLVQKCNATNSTFFSTTTASCTLPAPIGAHHVLIVSGYSCKNTCFAVGTQATHAVTDSQSLAYTQSLYSVFTSPRRGGDVAAESIWYAETGATTGSDTVTLTLNSASGNGILVTEWDGLATSSPVVGTSSVSGSYPGGGTAPITYTGGTIAIGGTPNVAAVVASGNAASDWIIQFVGFQAISGDDLLFVFGDCENCGGLFQNIPSGYTAVDNSVGTVDSVFLMGSAGAAAPPPPPAPTGTEYVRGVWVFDQADPGGGGTGGGGGNSGGGGGSTPLAITSVSPLPAAAQNSSYSVQLGATGGTPPYTWTISSGTLPAGLSLNGGSSFDTGSSFVTTFDNGALPSGWVIDTGSAPGNIGGVNSGTFATDHCDFTQGILDLKLTQTGSSPVNSVGCEMRSTQAYGYGTYHVIARAASTATTPNGTGSAVSGSDSSPMFLYLGTPVASTTEIDSPEIEGRTPNNCEWTNWQTTSSNQSTITSCTAPDQVFHDYSFTWQPGRIDYYVDGVLAVTHTSNVPTAPAYILTSLWGTNSNTFGGAATVGTTRHQYVKQISYTPAAGIETSGTNWNLCFTVACAGGAVDATSATQTFGATSVISMTGPAFADALFYYKIASSTANAATSFSSDQTINLDANGGTAQAFEYDLGQFVGGVEYMWGSQCNQATGKWQIWDQLHVAWVDISPTLACSLSVLSDHHIQWAVHRVPGSHFMIYDTLTIDGTVNVINMSEPAGPTSFADGLTLHFQLDEGVSGTSLSETLKNVSFTATTPGTGTISGTPTTTGTSTFTAQVQDSVAVTATKSLSITVLAPGGGGGGGGGNPSCGAKCVALAWLATPCYTNTVCPSYNVKRSTTNGGPYTTIATGVTNTSCDSGVPAPAPYFFYSPCVKRGHYNDASVHSGITYYYRVSSVISAAAGFPGGESPNSNQAIATIP